MRQKSRRLTIQPAGFLFFVTVPVICLIGHNLLCISTFFEAIVYFFILCFQLRYWAIQTITKVAMRIPTYQTCYTSLKTPGQKYLTVLKPNKEVSFLPASPPGRHLPPRWAFPFCGGCYSQKQNKARKPAPAAPICGQREYLSYLTVEKSGFLSYHHPNRFEEAAFETVY